LGGGGGGGGGQTAESYISVLLVEDVPLCLEYDDKMKLYKTSVASGWHFISTY